MSGPFKGNPFNAARGGGGVSALSATVPTSAGAVYTISRLLGGASVLSLLAGTNGNLTLSGAALSATVGIAEGASQIAVIREVSGQLAVEYPLTLTGAAPAPTPTPTPTPTPAPTPTPTPTPTSALLADNGDFLTADNGDFLTF